MRFTLPVAALLITALIASSSLRALGLGNVTAQSALGQPLRVVIPITAAAGEIIGTSCFKVITASNSDHTPQLLTARVSIERDTAEARLIVSSTQAIDDPVLRLTSNTEWADYFTHIAEHLLGAARRALEAAAM